MIGIGTNNVDSVIAWCERMGTSYPVAGDFWPHGLVAMQYGVMRGSGVADRAMFLVDEAGIVRFRGLYRADEVPPVEPVLEALRELAGAAR